MNFKRVVLWAVAGISLALAGCVVKSVYPFYANKDLVYDDYLVGTWSPDKPLKDNPESWIFAREGDAYKLTIVNAKETSVLTTHLFKLKTQLFMDWCVQTDETSAIEAHQLLKVTQIQPSLKLALLNHDWLRAYLEMHPKALSHVVDAGRTNKDEPVTLMASTAELQKFVLKHMNDRGTVGGETNMFVDLDPVEKADAKSK